MTGFKGAGLERAVVGDVLTQHIGIHKATVHKTRVTGQFGVTITADGLKLLTARR
jgi:hypothetical protein